MYVYPCVFTKGKFSSMSSPYFVRIKQVSPKTCVGVLAISDVSIKESISSISYLKLLLGEGELKNTLANTVQGCLQKNSKAHIHVCMFILSVTLWPE